MVGLFLSACNSHPDITRVQKGMTSEQVTAIMGKPTNKQDLDGIIWLRYGDNQVVVLENGIVVNVVSDAMAVDDSIKKLLDTN
jgi:hypothetical protein